MRRFDRLLSEALRWSIGDYPEYLLMCGEIPFDYIKDRGYLTGPTKVIEPDIDEFDPDEGPFPDEDKFSNTYDAVGIFSPKKECYFFSYRTTAPPHQARLLGRPVRGMFSCIV